MTVAVYTHEACAGHSNGEGHPEQPARLLAAVNGIKKLPRVTGPWMLEVKKAGRYRITLRQFPVEAGKTVEAVKAEMKARRENR